MMHITTNMIDFNWWSLALSEYVVHPLIMVTLCLLSVFVVLGNLLVVSAIWHEHQLHSVTNYLIASLAAADCLVGAVVMPFSIISEIIIGSWTFGAAWCDLWHSFDVLASTASIMNLCAISLDRYLAITDPISYPSRMTPKRVALLIVSLWTCSSLISFPAILWWRAVGQGPLEQFIPYTTTISPFDIPPTFISLTPIDEPKVPQFKCVFTDDPYYLLFSSFISFYGPLCVMLYAYYRIYKAAVQQTRFLKYGSKQVMVGRNKKKKRSRHISEHSSIGAIEKNRFNEETCDGISSMQSYDRQHLVLRVHRGGGGSSSITTKGSVSDMTSVKGSNERKRKENQNSSSFTSKTNLEIENDKTRGKVDEINMLSNSQDDRSNNNFPQHLLLKRQMTLSSSSNYQDRTEFSNRNSRGSSRRDKLRVDSQRFDSKQPEDNLISVNDCNGSHIRPIDSESISSQYNSAQPEQQRAKPLLAYIKNRSTSVDVSVFDHSNSIGRCIQTQAKYPQNNHQKDSSFIEIEDKDNNSNNQFQDTTNYTNSADSDEDLSDEMGASDSLSSSSASYGTGSIASVMVKPDLFQKNSDDKSHNRINSNTSHQQLGDTRLKRAFSYGEAHNCELGPTLRLYEIDNEDVFISPLDQAPLKTRIQQQQQQQQHPNKFHRASCGDSSFHIKTSDGNSALGRSYGSRAAKTLNIRSWVKLTRMRDSSKIEGNQSENVLIKPPPSLMPLMIMNSDTSTDSSIVSSVIKRANRKGGRVSVDDRDAITKVHNFDPIKNSNNNNNNNNDKHYSDDIDTKMNVKASTDQDLGENEKHVVVDNLTDKNLTFKEDLESGEGCSGNTGNKGQMLYYNSEKLIQSIVDLNAIQYIDCANHNPKNHDSQNIECKVVNEVEKLDLDPIGQVHQLGNGRTNNIQRQHRGVGKKLSKLAKERKAAKTLGIVVGVFILCWLPFFVVNIVVALCGTNCIWKIQIFVPVVTWLGWLNSAMNPVIYACWSRDFRRAFRRVLCTWVEFVCPYDGAYLARKLKLKKSSNYSTQEAYLNRTASSIKGNTSSATIRSVGVSIDGRVHTSMNGKGARSLLSDQVA